MEVEQLDFVISISAAGKYEHGVGPAIRGNLNDELI